jgi:hypothetical protein
MKRLLFSRYFMSSASLISPFLGVGGLGILGFELRALHLQNSHSCLSYTYMNLPRQIFFNQWKTEDLRNSFIFSYTYNQ